MILSKVELKALRQLWCFAFNRWIEEGENEQMKEPIDLVEKVLQKYSKEESMK